MSAFQKVHSVDWNCTGKYLASGSVDQTARVWDVEHHSSVMTQTNLFFFRFCLCV